MKFAVYLLLIGACALFAETTPISETASPEVEDAEVEVEPEFVVEPEAKDSKKCPVESSPFFTCGDHNCNEMELLESIMLALNDFDPHVNHKPDCPLAQPPPPPHPPHPPHPVSTDYPSAQPPPQPYPVCTDCGDSQFMILKVAGLLRSLADLLSLCGAPLPSCPHGAEPKSSEAPCPEAEHGAEPDPNFGKAEVEQFDKALDAIVCAIMDQIHEEVVSEEESAEEEAFEEMEEEEAKEEEAKEELAEEEAAKEKEKSEEVVKKDLEVTPEEVETLNPEAENEAAPAPRRSHKKSKKKKKEPANEVVTDEEQQQSSMMDSPMDVFNLSG